MTAVPADLVSLAEAFAAFPAVRAVALAGSSGAGNADGLSDYDLYVYADTGVAVADRRALAERLGRAPFEIDNHYWETGDEWCLADSGMTVDIMYRDPCWIEERLAAVLDRHEPSLGYTTCFWDNLLSSLPLFDRLGWFGELQHRARVPYPEGLARAIIRHNRPLLRTTISSYRVQLVKAAKRHDPVSLNHRLAAFLASWFDILFAVNRVPHPGEKRLLTQAAARCAVLPEGFPGNVESLLQLVGSGQPEPAALGEAIDRVCRALESLLVHQ